MKGSYATHRHDAATFSWSQYERKRCPPFNQYDFGVGLLRCRLSTFVFSSLVAVFSCLFFLFLFEVFSFLVVVFEDFAIGCWSFLPQKMTISRQTTHNTRRGKTRKMCTNCSFYLFPCFLPSLLQWRPAIIHSFLCCLLFCVWSCLVFVLSLTQWVWKCVVCI